MKLLYVASLVFLVSAHPEQNPGFEYEEPLLYDTFPEGFLWGAATAAYQVIL